MLIPFYCSALPEDAELLALAQQMAADWSDKRFRRRPPTTDGSAGAEAAWGRPSAGVGGVGPAPAQIDAAGGRAQSWRRCGGVGAVPAQM
jgi:hypothetical protein